MSETTAHDFPEVYADLGVDLRSLGCVMLDTEQPDTSWIPDEVLYKSPDEKKFWINGKDGQKHVTLRYGLLPQVRRTHVDAVMKGAEIPGLLYINDIEVFASPYEDEPYDCLVARVAAPGLVELNQRLGLLPNVNTFPTYKPHVTLAYTRQGWYAENYGNRVHEGFRAFYGDYVMEPIRTTDINYGKMQA